MVAILKPGTTEEQMKHLLSWLKQLDIDVSISSDEDRVVLGLLGDTTHVDMELLKNLDIVSDVMRISEPFKRVNRKLHPSNTVITVGSVRIGDGDFVQIAGPCSVESEDQIISIAQAVKSAGADILRGGAYKPRTSPYAFQGLKDEGLRLLLAAKEATGLPVITEIINVRSLDLFEDVDIIQVGARNMQNFDLLQELGRVQKPIMLKRGLANTLKELLMSAEYIMSEGNQNIILCERGIRTYETFTRNTLDISAVPVLHELSHLPVVIDPSHASGDARYVPSMALAAVAAGADGVMVEVHNNPDCALCDGLQSLTPDQYSVLSRKMTAVRRAIE